MIINVGIQICVIVDVIIISLLINEDNVKKGDYLKVEILFFLCKTEVGVAVGKILSDFYEAVILKIMVIRMFFM